MTPDNSGIADENLFDASLRANYGANHPDDDLPDDNAIRHQDPNERLDEGLSRAEW